MTLTALTLHLTMHRAAAWQLACHRAYDNSNLIAGKKSHGASMERIQLNKYGRTCTAVGGKVALCRLCAQMTLRENEAIRQ